MFFLSTAPIIARETLRKIDEYLERDQGRTFRRLLRETMPLAEDAYDDKESDGFRSHLGASLIGRDCSRELWYSFRWAATNSVKSRMLRLFNRGHLEEPRFVALLKMIECEVWQYDDQHRQFKVSYHEGHFGGSLDSVLRGCPDWDPSIPILGEFKTHNDKSFVKLAGSDWSDYLEGKKPFNGEGVRNAKFEHFVQMQTYMKGFSLPAALYMAVNKNDDTIYAEIIKYDAEQAEQYNERGRNIILSTEPPKRISDTPGWYKCKFCDYPELCHLNGKALKNCRTCVFSKPSENKTWVCEKHHCILDRKQQVLGCSDHIQFTNV